MNRKVLISSVVIIALLIIGIAVFMSGKQDAEPILAELPAASQIADENTSEQTQNVAESTETYDLEQDKTLPQAAPEPEIVEVVEPVEQPVVEEKTQALAATEITIRVIEEGTEMPLPRVQISHEFVDPLAAEEESEDNRGRRGWGNFDWGNENSIQTNDEGIAVLSIESSEEVVQSLQQNQPIKLSARWGVGPRHESEEIKLIPYSENEAVIVYPARQIHRVKLTDVMENPVPNYTMDVSPQQYNFWEGDIYLPQEVTTDAEGFAEFRAYPQRRSLLQVEVPDVALFKTEEGRGTEQGNPLSLRTRIEDNDEFEIVLLQDVVRVNAKLINAPEVKAGFERSVSIEAVDDEADIDYWTIPIEDDAFSFSVPVDTDVNVYISQREEFEGGNPRDMRRMFERSPDVELKQLIDIPEKAGEMDVDLEFPEREKFLVKVFLPDGEPAENVEVRAYGSASESAAEEASASNNGWRGRRDQFLGRIDGTTSVASEPTNNSGVAELDLPPAKSYFFDVVEDTLPEEAKGREPIEMSWEEMESKGEIVILLLPSSLLWGEVIDWNGKPVADATVHLRGPDIPWNDDLFETETDEFGFFELNVPPVRLTEPDPEEPPDYYVFAYARNQGGGLGKAIIDNPEEAINIQINPFAELRVDVTYNGQPVQEIEFNQQYDVPGFDVPISSRNSGNMDEDDGRYRFRFLIEEISTVSIWTYDISDENPASLNSFTIPIDDSIGENNHVSIDFAKPGEINVVEPDTESDDEEISFQGGGNRQRGRGF